MKNIAYNILGIIGIIVLIAIFIITDHTHEEYIRDQILHGEFVIVKPLDNTEISKRQRIDSIMAEKYILKSDTSALK